MELNRYEYYVDTDGTKLRFSSYVAWEVLDNEECWVNCEVSLTLQSELVKDSKPWTG